MTYWHLQIKYYDIIKEDEKSFLLISDRKDNKDLFITISNKIKNSDIIFIKDRNRPKYLVQVINIPQKNKIEIKKFDLNTKILNNYPLGSIDTEIQEISSPDSPAYKYIMSLVQGNMKDYIRDIKLKELYITSYKMFKDFKINFINNKGESLPIVIIAGANGTGKTSLLEIIFNFKRNYRYFLEDSSYLKAKYRNNEIKIDKNFIKSYEVIEREDKERTESKFKQGHEIVFSYIPDSFDGFIFLEKNITYIKALDDNIGNVKKYILAYYRRESRRLDSYNIALEKIRDYIKKIFLSLNLTFELLDIDDTDRDNEKVTFKNKSGREFDINSLSTGEKTLLSKVLYLYFKDVKNQIILIDEPELSLHPAWQNKVLKLYENFANENNCQIIIATHSPHIIGSAKNEYIRLLTTNEKNEIKVVDKDVYAHGRDINSILFDVMGEVRYRPLKEFDEKIDYLYHYIDEQEFDKAKEILKELEKNYGKNDKVILEAKMTIDMLNYQD